MTEIAHRLVQKRHLVTALSHNGYDNNVARITGNVLKRFMMKDALDQIIA